MAKKTNTFFSKKIDELRTRFLSKLVETQGQLDQLLETLIQNDNREDSVRTLGRILNISHRLAGTAGTFGLDQLSELGQQLEKHATELLNNTALLDRHAPLSREESAPIRQLIEAINQESSFSGDKKVIMNPLWETACSTSHSPSIQSKTVIVVDGDMELVRLLQIQLSHYGFELIALCDHRQLPATLKNYTPIVVMMDIIFPGDVDTGVNTIKELRESGELSCAVVFFSVRDDLTARLAAIRAGADGYFLKPINIAQIVGYLNLLTDNVAEAPYRVVVIEQDSNTTGQNTQKLQQAGLFATTVTNPMKTMAAIREWSPEVILMDVDMQQCNGFELTKVIRQHDSFLHTPIICLSSANLEEDRLKAIQVGADECLSKTTLSETLVASIVSRAKRARQLNTTITKLSMNETRFRSVTETARDAIVTTDAQNRIVTWNHGAETLFGHTEAEIQGSQVTALFQENDRHWYTDDFECIEMSGVKKDSSSFPVEVSKTNWVCNDKQFSTNIIRDINNRKQHEKTLHDAKILAENANQAKSEFLSAMSHELRTPMNAILGFNQMLEFNPTEPLSKTQKKCVDRIMKSGKHLLELIDDILDLAKIEAGKVDMNIIDIQVNTFLDECITLVQPSAAERNIHLKEVSHPAHMLPVRGDYTRLKQVMLNLLSNGIKYNHEGGSISISCQTIITNVRITVSDTGIGIPPNKRQELFQPFSRLGAEATEVEGTGIGLSVCRKLMGLMDGRIGIDHDTDIGASFWIELPLSTSDTCLTDAPPCASPASVTNNLDLGGMTATLLYVENDPENLSLMEMAVKNIKGLQLISTYNGELGVQLARTQKPDIIILDINLPGMSGFQTFEKLKSNDKTTHIPVIALSAATTQADIDQCMDAGFCHYLTKPMKVPDMINIIHSIL